MKIYAAAAVEAFRKKERQNETQFITPKLMEKLVWSSRGVRDKGKTE